MKCDTCNKEGKKMIRLDGKDICPSCWPIDLEKIIEDAFNLGFNRGFTYGQNKAKEK